MNDGATRDLAFDLPLSGVYLVEASAGTGKTFTLTAWMLRLLLECDPDGAGVPLPKLLAVTFTRAATAELRERVRRRLRIAERALAGEVDAGAEAGQTRALIEQARQRGIGDDALRLRLQSALLQLDEAAIFTIHGFCQRALREFGFLAGALDEDELIDDAGEAWREVAADLWRAASQGDEAEFAWLATLWTTPEALARDLPALCDPARRLLPDPDASPLAAWLHRLREDAAVRFAQWLSARHHRTQDQLIERVWRASAQPRFAAALKRRWPLLLVDEFQDTDPRQWDIFRRMHEAADDDEAVAVPAGLFLIGDPKQAIYRFRGGDLPTYLAARDYARWHGGEATLTVNYRSRLALLAGVEALFAASAAPFVDRGIDFIHVEAAPHNRTACLRIDGEVQPGVGVHWLPDEGARSNSQGKALALRETVHGIVRVLSAGTLDEGDGERRVRPGDIAVLVRSNDQAGTMREALARAGVAAAVQSSRSVFASEAAAELSCLLHAFAAPADPSRLRAALATRLLGETADRIAARDADPRAMQREQQRFEQAGQAWRQRGPLPALLPFLSAAAPRLLNEDGGARLLTDALHLAELLQAESPSQHGLNGLLRWFLRQRRDGDNREERALRMESDAQAVQVMTLHKSKGLEFPLVFLPYTAFAGGGGQAGLKKTLASDADGHPAIYFHADGDAAGLRADDALHARLLADEERAALAEDLRLFYVGLTRARFAVQLTGGCSRTQDFKASPLKWLLFGDRAVGSKKGETPTAQLLGEAHAALSALAADSGEGLRLYEVPAEREPATLPATEDTTTPPPARVPQRQLRGGRGQYSFSGLRARHAELLPARGADDENAGGDDDPRLRGADFGNAVHDVLQAADFAAWRGVDAVPASQHALLRRMLDKRGLPSDKRAVAQAAALVAQALNVPLPGIATLAELDPARRVAEMEFHFRLAPVRLPALYALLREHGYPRRQAPAQAGEIEGLMHGYIDLVYRDDAGRYLVLDYKTNRLHGYAPEVCAEAVRDNDYDLQYLIYLVALQRWLRLRFGATYDAPRQLGGAVYLFLRGLQPGDDASGLHRDRPPQELIDALDALFDGGAA